MPQGIKRPQGQKDLGKKTYRKMQEDIEKSMYLDEMNYPFSKREWINNEIGIFVTY